MKWIRRAAERAGRTAETHTLHFRAPGPCSVIVTGGSGLGIAQGQLAGCRVGSRSVAVPLAIGGHPPSRRASHPHRVRPSRISLENQSAAALCFWFGVTSGPGNLNRDRTVLEDPMAFDVPAPWSLPRLLLLRAQDQAF